MKQVNLYIMVGLGGSLGACLRYAASFLFDGSSFPFATLAVNLIGCFFLTYLTKLLAIAELWSQTMKLVVTVGILGSFTTFSAFSLETYLLFEKNSWIAVIYMFSSVIGGVLTCWLGYSLAGKKVITK